MGLLQVRFHRRFIKFGCVALNNLKRACRAFPDTSAKPVTKNIAYQLCFSVYDGQRTLGATSDTCAASVALFFVYFDDFSFHYGSPLIETDSTRLLNRRIDPRQVLQKRSFAYVGNIPTKKFFCARLSRV
jgi:hypothetical protein